jgi:GT2 family glycosyltransferase
LDYPELVVILADNGSTDGSLALARKRSPGLRVIENEENLGFAAGNNRAIQQALCEGADYVVLLNNDALAGDHKLVTKLVDFARSRRVGPVSPVVLYTDTDIVWMAGARVDYLLGRMRYIGKGKRYSEFSSRSPYITEFVQGCCMLLSRELLEEVGLLDEDYFFFFEDTDYCLRAAAAGLPSYVVPEAFAYHGKSASSGKAGKDSISQFQAYQVGRSSMIFAGKRLSGARRASFTAAQCSFTLGYVAVRSRSVMAIREYVKGILDGFRSVHAKTS